MATYIKIDSSEKTAVKKTVLETLASNVQMQDTLAKIIKLKKSKKTAMTGLATAIKKINQEIAEIKEALPALESKPEKVKAKGKIRYQLELEKIKEKISKLG